MNTSPTTGKHAGPYAGADVLQLDRYRDAVTGSVRAGALARRYAERRIYNSRNVAPVDERRIARDRLRPVRYPVTPAEPDDRGRSSNVVMATALGLVCLGGYGSAMLTLLSGVS